MIELTRKSGLFAVALLVLATNTSYAQQFRTVSVFSSINPKSFVAAVQEITRPNRLTADAVTKFGTTLNFDVAKSMTDVSSSDANAISQIVKAPSDVLRRNVVMQNASQFNEVLASAQTDRNLVPILSFDLFENVNLKVVAQSIKRMADGTLSIAGSVQDMPGTFATLTKKGDDLFGTIKTYSELYEIRPSRATTLSPLVDFLPQPAGTTVIDEVRTDFKNEAEPTAPQISKKRSSNEFDAVPGAGDDTSQPSIPPTIDVGIFYTDQAERAASGAGAMNSLAIQAIQSVQSSLDNYKVRASINLISVAKLNYNESGNIKTDRDRLQNPSDGYMDDVPVQRDKLKADIVALVIETADDCGVSYIPEQANTDYSDYAYIVVRRSCMVGNLSFAHEFGHILGVRHDRYIDPLEGMPLAANHGMIFKCGNRVCRDIPAYEDYCYNVLHTSCGRLAAWSGIVWPGGQPIPETPNDIDNNAQRALRLFAPIVARYR